MPRNRSYRHLGILICTLILHLLGLYLPSVAERVTLVVRETAGIRRFGYPVATQLELERPAAPATQFRLTQDGKPVVAQFRPLTKSGDRLNSVAVDFDSNFMPYESRSYIVEYGEDVTPTPEPDRGMKIDETDESFIVSNGPNLVWEVPKDLLGLLRSVKTAKWDYLRPDSAGLSVRLNGGRQSRVGSSEWRTKATIVKNGPIDCALRFDSQMIATGLASSIALDFPRSKSWVHVEWTIDDPSAAVTGLGADLNFQLGDGPTLVDFGVEGSVYATVPDGQVVALSAGSSDIKDFADGRVPRPFWNISRGKPAGSVESSGSGGLEPYVTASSSRDPVSIEGWAHVMDRQRCVALAFEDFGKRCAELVEVASDGRVKISRQFAGDAGTNISGPKRLAFWLHFVPFPPHVGAVTSPQSMQSPLAVQWKWPQGAGEPPPSKCGDDAADSKNSNVMRETEALSTRARAALAKTSGEIPLAGLQQKVEVFRDPWGVPHIYAQNMRDLFFAQGFVQAQDRLWQMEIWRRTTQGKLAEIVGPKAIERDRFARLIQYHGGMAAEWESYGPDARIIVESFVRGVNAYIDLCSDNLPIEFQVTGIKPEPWTPDVCLGRMAGFIMCRNATNEVLRAQLIREVGAERAAELLPIDPKHDIQLPDGLDLDGIDQKVIAGINAANAAIQLPLADSQHQASSAHSESAENGHIALSLLGSEDAETSGSNNWVIAGRHTGTGKPILANDPHRPITLPSLRYIVHLNCAASDGWNVIGGTEPALPGVAIGHNEHIAWGLTIVGTDQADIYVEETDPGDANRYRVGDEWQSMRIRRVQIRVQGESDPREIELKFTRHGPVIFEDADRHRAYALRWTGSEPGAAGYMGSLALDRAQDWQQFLSAAGRWKVPSENLVYADVDGHIGWIAAALTPKRNGWDGLLPVPGASGKYEWAGFLSTSELPQQFDPPAGYIATANHNILPRDYPHMIGYEWAVPARFQRIDDVLRDQIRRGAKLTIQDSERLQHDATSLPALRLVALLRQAKLDLAAEQGTLPVRECVAMLGQWDGVLTRDSAAAAVYTVWQQKVTERVLKPRVPEKLWERYSSRGSLAVAIDMLERPSNAANGPGDFDNVAILLDSLREAVGELVKRQGPDPAAWRLGTLHQAAFTHMLAAAKSERAAQANQPQPANEQQQQPNAPEKAASDSTAALGTVLNLPSVPRDGDAHTPIATGGPNYQQTAGASYRQVIDLADWDHSTATSVPGQSGQPTSPHYGDLLPLWERGEYFPLLFSRAAVEAAAKQKLVLIPTK